MHKYILLLTLPLLIAWNSEAPAQQLLGPDRVTPGTLAIFEIEPNQEASWCLSPNEPVDCWKTDSDSSRLFFATPQEGKYTIIAAMIVDGKPVLLSKTFVNAKDGIKPSPDPDPQPSPTPSPPSGTLETWIKEKVPILVKSKNLAAETQLVANAFDGVIKRINEGTIKTTQNARAQLQITLTASLAQASATAVTDWSVFLAELSRQMETQLVGKITDLSEVKKTFQIVADTMKLLELPRSPPIKPPIQTFQNIFQVPDCPECISPSSRQYRFNNHY